MNNDVASNLRQIREWSNRSLVHRMVTIQRCKQSTQSSLNWREGLRFLELDDDKPRVLKCFVPGRYDKVEYTALSYPWAASTYEERCVYSWTVYTDGMTRRANIRDAVLDRVSKFMRHFEIEYLWTDNECINQDDKEEKRETMEKMHYIYARSFHPVALLFVPIRTENELGVLLRLLKGDLITLVRRRKRDAEEDFNHDEYILSSDITAQQAYSFLDLIHRIVSDDWWSRAWCFQEDYVSMKAMSLLLPTFVDVSDRADDEYISFMAGEIAIGARDFRQAVTRFVFAYRLSAEREPKTWVIDKGLCRYILERAGWYAYMSVHGHTLNLENGGKALATQILADLRNKKCTIPSDLIHISTNCNLYPLTLNTQRLTETSDGVALSLIVLFFINGEIFKNGIQDGPSFAEAVDLNAFDYVKSIAFDEFPTNGEPGQLAWLRKYRFVSPVLTPLGVQTVGHVWQIDENLCLTEDTWSFLNSPLPLQSDSARDNATDDQTSRTLTAIRDNLPPSCRILHAALTGFLERDFDPYWQNKRSSAASALSVNAADFAFAILQGCQIGIGHVMSHDEYRVDKSNKLGLFAVDADLGSRQVQYVFTAWQSRTKGRRQDLQRSIEDRLVSLQVCIDEQQSEKDTPQLRTMAWMPSLCFCAGVKHTKATFPWPRSLLDENKSAG